MECSRSVKLTALISNSPIKLTALLLIRAVSLTGQFIFRKINFCSCLNLDIMDGKVNKSRVGKQLKTEGLKVCWHKGLVVASWLPFAVEIGKKNWCKSAPEAQLPLFSHPFLRLLIVNKNEKKVNIAP